STQCQILDQKVIDVKDAVAGNNYPPLHPNCRSTTVASFETSYKERVGRNKENVNIIVSGDMKYEVWNKYHETGKFPKVAEIEIKPIEIVPIEIVPKVVVAKVVTPKVVKKPVNAEKSLESLIKKNWVVRSLELYKDMDKAIADANIIELDILTTKYKKVTTHSMGTKNGFIVGIDEKTKAYAYCGRSVLLAGRQEIKFSKKLFKDSKNLLRMTKHETKTKFKMPSEEKNSMIYTMRHEFGHMIQNCLRDEELKRNPKKLDELKTEFRSVKTQYEQNLVIAKLNRIDRKIEKEHATRILEIATEMYKKDGKGENDYISEYGTTNNAEYFAEIFANSQEDKPNIYGRAMLQFLKEKGVDKI
ncbi:MAG: hypothetical protein ACRC6E_02810, partial [Fusobacteriaceae bacterium]